MDLANSHPYEQAYCSAREFHHLTKLAPKASRVIVSKKYQTNLILDEIESFFTNLALKLPLDRIR